MTTPLRVLLVEHSIADAEQELWELQRGGYKPIFERVETLESMKSALAKGGWEIILSDYVMPRFSALAALKLAQEMGVDLPFIVVAGQVGEEAAVESMRAGANDYVLKVNLTRLVPAIQRELRDAKVPREHNLADIALDLAREALRQANSQMERRVEERTRELAAERERLAITLRSIADAVITTDRQGQVILMNNVAEELTGWNEKDAIGQALDEVFHLIDQQTREVLRNPIETVLKTGEIVGLADSSILVARDGAEQVIDDSAALIRGENGAIIGIVLVFRDVTERKRAEQALHEEGKYRNLFMNMTEEVHFWELIRDGEGRIKTWRLVDANPPTLKTWGKTLNEVQGRTTDEIFGPGASDHYLPIVQQIMTEGVPYSYEDYFPNLDKYFRFTSIPLGDHFITTSADITELRKSNEGLRESEERLRRVLGNMVDGVFVCEADRRIIMANESGVRMLGFAKVEEATRAVADFSRILNLRHLDGSPMTTEELPLVRALAGDIVVKDDQIARNLQTHRDMYIRVSAAPIRDEKGKVVGAVAVVRDITDLADFDRLKDEFIEVAAHELRTPVTIMKGSAQALLITAKAVPSVNREMLEAIDRGADRIDRIVKDLLDISKIVLDRIELTKESVDLLELVERIVNRLALTTSRHQIRKEGLAPSPGPLLVSADHDRLEQVVANLIDNAIRYSPMGGDIEVGVQVRDREAIVSVTDHGIGIPVERQKHIFERFYRAHTGTPFDYGGMGVGLFICNEIVARHGGRMWFESERGKGSTFYFTLPLA